MTLTLVTWSTDTLELC